MVSRTSNGVINFRFTIINLQLNIDDIRRTKNEDKKFALDIIDLYEQMPKTVPNNKFYDQLIRSGSSVGANYRAACRAKSTADFINKLKIVEEADESIYFRTTPCY